MKRRDSRGRRFGRKNRVGHFTYPRSLSYRVRRRFFRRRGRRMSDIQPASARLAGAPAVNDDRHDGDRDDRDDDQLEILLYHLDVAEEVAGEGEQKNPQHAPADTEGDET